jgi:hypothetical protein
MKCYPSSCFSLLGPHTASAPLSRTCPDKALPSVCVSKFRTHINANDYEEISIAKKEI